MKGNTTKGRQVRRIRDAARDLALAISGSKKPYPGRVHIDADLIRAIQKGRAVVEKYKGKTT